MPLGKVGLRFPRHHHNDISVCITELDTGKVYITAGGSRLLMKDIPANHSKNRTALTVANDKKQCNGRAKCAGVWSRDLDWNGLASFIHTGGINRISRPGAGGRGRWLGGWVAGRSARRGGGGGAGSVRSFVRLADRTPFLPLLSLGLRVFRFFMLSFRYVYTFCPVLPARAVSSAGARTS